MTVQRLTKAISIVSLGKYGTFSSNLVIERPYNLTYELLDRDQGQKDSDLRIVPASEIHADTIAEENAANSKLEDGIVLKEDGVEFQLVGENGEVVMRSNRETIDDSARQTLTMDEIEELKREGTGAGKDLIAKLMLSHTAIEQKTTFSLAKYKLVKSKKYLRRFTILPLDVAMLTHYMLEEKDATKIMEIQEEMLALAGCWANVQYAEDSNTTDVHDTSAGGRWLVVDETGGLIVAAMAERMGILYAEHQSHTSSDPEEQQYSNEVEPTFATTNTMTLLHNNSQPNLTLLKYFSFILDHSDSNHPLITHLLPLSWLQLISPHLDAAYSTAVPTLSAEELSNLKTGKRGTYYRKRRRWARTNHIVDSTRRGDFTGLLIASSMDPVSILRHLIPLLRGGAPIAIYSPNLDPLIHLSDVYSTTRRTAFIQSPPSEFEGMSREEKEKWPGNEDFPLNPTLVLSASVQTSRVMEWQVLPGRTHPKMTGRGGAEGFLWTATRVIPAEGKVEARGTFVKKRKGKEVEGEKEDQGESKKARVEAEEKAEGADVSEQLRVDEVTGEAIEEERTGNNGLEEAREDAIPKGSSTEEVEAGEVTTALP